MLVKFKLSAGIRVRVKYLNTGGVFKNVGLGRLDEIVRVRFRNRVGVGVRLLISIWIRI